MSGVWTVTPVAVPSPSLVTRTAHALTPSAFACVITRSGPSPREPNGAADAVAAPAVISPAIMIPATAVRRKLRMGVPFLGRVDCPDPYATAGHPHRRAVTLSAAGFSTS